jgi:hypothetical protein
VYRLKLLHRVKRRKAQRFTEVFGFRLITERKGEEEVEIYELVKDNIQNKEE